MASTSFNESESTSTPILVNTPQSDWLYQLSQMLGSLAQSQYQWGLSQFSKLDSLTDQQIDNFLRLGDVGAQMAQGLQSRYDQIYGPQADAYANEAQTYASPQRMLHSMGRAQAGVMQAGKQALDNAERELEAFGIDPSSGRYQDLVRASHTANAAAAAAAGEVERARVEQEGARRRENAMAYGQNLPSQAVNALNSAFQGVSGAVNAALGRANAGVALTQSAAPYYNAAMQMKLPPVGQNTVSHSRGGSQSASPSGGGGSRQPQRPRDQGGGRGGGQSPGGGGDQSMRPAYDAQYNGPGLTSRFVPKENVQQVPGGGQGPTDGDYPSFWQNTVPDPNNLMPGGDRIPNLWSGEYPNQIQGDHAWQGQWGTSTYNPWTGAYSGPSNDQWANDPFGNSSWSADPTRIADPWGQYSNMPDWSLPADPWTQGMFDADSWYNQYQQQQMTDGMYDAWGGNPSYSDPWSSQFYDYGQQNYDPWASQNQWYNDPWSGSSDWYNSVPQSYDAPTSGWDAPTSNVSDYWSNSGGGGWDTPSYDTSAWDSGYNWAKGGPVSTPRGRPMPGGGGQVHPSMSPSGGRQIDDVPAVIQQTGQQAMLNSDEFVIPRDVALWKGQEFFQTLIKKSREARVGAPAKPSSKKPQGTNPGT